MKKIRMFCAVNSVAAIVCGAVLYALNGDNRILSNIFGFSIKNDTLSLINCYIPDWLWAYALCFALCMFNSEKIACIISVLSGVLWEMLQRFGIVSGTSDIVDIFMYLTASLTAVMIIKIQKRRYTK